MMTEGKPKLLVVEDDEGLQAQLKWAYDDFDVVIVGDRAGAIAAVRADEPAVVTLDLGLPPDPDGTSEGLAVLDQIMALKPDTKVIVASGHGARESALTAIECGAYDFYQKPIDIEQLGLIVRRALNLHRIEAENRLLAEKAGEGNRVLGGLITAAPEMIRAMGGRLDVESHEGLGTRFVVHLPLAEAAELIRTMQKRKTEVA
jgi:two-component system NtrC family response regulator